jgi:hypothetical protein
MEISREKKVEGGKVVEIFHIFGERLLAEGVVSINLVQSLLPSNKKRNQCHWLLFLPILY